MLTMESAERSTSPPPTVIEHARWACSTARICCARSARGRRGVHVDRLGVDGLGVHLVVRHATGVNQRFRRPFAAASRAAVGRAASSRNTPYPTRPRSPCRCETTWRGVDGNPRRSAGRIPRAAAHDPRPRDTYTGAMTRLHRITQDPDVTGGRPCIRGLRVTVGTVVGLLVAGHDADEVLAAYPYLERDDISQALAYAAGRSEEQEVTVGSS